MGNAPLVAIDNEIGLQLLRVLDDSAVPINVALWLYSPEYEDWRFVLASRLLDSGELRRAYGIVHDALAAGGLSLERTPPLLILKMSSPFIRELRTIFAKAKNVEGMRLGGQLIGNQFVDDAIVYRIR